MEIFEGWPLPATIGALFLIVLLRAGGTYAIGRGSRAGAKRLLERRSRARRPGNGGLTPKLEVAERVIERYGSPVVALSFLTVGFQTAVNLGAGIMRMPLIKYLPALAVGGLMWAFLYGVLGLATINAIIQAAERNPIAAIVSVVVVIGILVTVELVTRRARALAARTPAVDQVLPVDEGEPPVDQPRSAR